MAVESKLDWAEASAQVAGANRILIVTHMNPDGDAIGSMMGLALALRSQGKSIDTAVDDGVPGYLQFVPDTDKVFPKLTTGNWDLMISVDSSDEERSGDVGVYGRKHSKAVINLDHHVTNTFFGDHHLVMVNAVSATEVVYRWLPHLGIELTPEIGVALLTGLLTDTLGFRTSNVKADTLGIAQALMQAGASITEITARTLDSTPFRAIKLWSQSLQSVDLTDQIISVNITQADLKDAGIHDVSDNGLVGLLNQVSEAMIAVIFMELEDNRTKISLRSKRGYDVGSVALSIGGGGHTQAAGATVNGSLETTRERVFPLLQQAISEGALIIA
jgi:phosphoesterase RecJ-like protein